MTQLSTVDAPQGTDAAPRPNGVVVTGAARGLGRAIAAGFARDGAVVVGVDLDVSVEAAMDELGPGHAGLVGDVADPAVLEAAFRTAAAAGGGLAALVLNAGVTAPGETADYPVEQWDRILGVNLRAAVPRRQGGLPPSAARIEHRHGLLDLRLPGLRRPRRLLRLQVGRRRPGPGPGRRVGAVRHPRQRGGPGHGGHRDAAVHGRQRPDLHGRLPRAASRWAASPTPPRSPTRSSTSPRRGPATSPASSSPSTAGGRSRGLPAQA